MSPETHRTPEPRSRIRLSGTRLPSCSAPATAPRLRELELEDTRVRRGALCDVPAQDPLGRIHGWSEHQRRSGRRVKLLRRRAIARRADSWSSEGRRVSVDLNALEPWSSAAGEARRAILTLGVRMSADRRLHRRDLLLERRRGSSTKLTPLRGSNSGAARPGACGTPLPQWSGRPLRQAQSAGCRLPDDFARHYNARTLPTVRRRERSRNSVGTMAGSIMFGRRESQRNQQGRRFGEAQPQWLRLGNGANALPRQLSMVT